MRKPVILKPDVCPKTNKKIRKMLEEGTIWCYINHAFFLRCSDVACCEDCEKFDGCPVVCETLKGKRLNYVS